MKKGVIFFIAVALVSINLRCTLFNHISEIKNVSAINFKDNLTSVVESNLEKLRNGSVFYYYNDYKVLEIEVIHTDLSVNYVKDSVIIGDSILATNLIKRYFIFKKGIGTALQFDSLAKVKLNKVIADTIMKMNGHASFTHDKKSLVLKKTETSKTFCKLTYEVKDRMSIYYADSVYFYLTSKLKGFDFTLDEEIDKIYGMKLYKTERVYNSLYRSLPNETIGLPKLLTEEIEEVKVKNPDFIIYLCKLFDKEITQ